MKWLFTATLLMATAFAAAAKSPNFVFFLVDDLGKGDLGIEGSTFYETPNIDALAQRSLRFDRGYSACQVCSPSRAALQTGKAPARLGITDYIAANGSTQPEKWNRNTPLLPARNVLELPLEEVTMAEALKENGYRTFFAGKWHLGGDGFTPSEQGYDVNVGGYHYGTPPGGYFPPYQNPKLSDGPAGEELPVRLGQETAKFIREQSQREEPFFAMLSFYSVHGPIQCSEERWKYFRAKAEKMGLTERTEPRFKLDRGKEVRQVQDHPVYAGMMAALDDGVGVVLAELKALGIEEDTVVIFTSDNGGVSSGDGFATSALPMRGGKGRQWEGGVRQPFYISWPGVTQGGVTQVPAIGMDFYPTLLEIAGAPAKPEQHVDGVSLAPVLRGEAGVERPLFWHYPHYGNQGGEPSAIMAQGEWKLIHYFEDGRDELYQLSVDPGEETDVAADHGDRVASMRSALEEWQKSVAAVNPTPNPNYKVDSKEEAKAEAAMAKREQEHAEFLKADFVPRGGWWDQKGK